jgi:HlyD family secretion protein
VIINWIFSVILLTIYFYVLRFRNIEQNFQKSLSMKASLVAFMLFVALVFSCTGKKSNSIITFQLKRSDYVEKITVSGTVEAVVNNPVTPPSLEFGQITVMKLAADGATVKRGDIICILSAPELESAYLAARTTLDSLEAGLKRTEADNKLNIAMLEAQLATSEAQMKISSLDSLRMNYATEVEQKLLNLEMKKALIEKEKTYKKLVATRMIAETDIKQINARIIQGKARVQSMADQVKSLTIRAQRDGMVARTESPKFYFMSLQGSGTVGGPIKEGSVLLMDIPILQFPDLSAMQVSAEVDETDFKKVEKGQHVFITVDAAEKLTTTGKVNRKNLIGRNAQRYSESQVKFYEVIIDVDSCHIKMKPGLSASCEIIITEAKDTLFVPTLAIYEKDSARVVYVKRKKQFIPVRVQAGYSGSSYTIIKEGLKGDEIIALSEPPGSLIFIEKEKEERTDTLGVHNQ